LVVTDNHHIAWEKGAWACDDAFASWFDLVPGARGDEPSRAWEELRIGAPLSHRLDTFGQLLGELCLEASSQLRDRMFSHGRGH
jgi:hypothetical protein